MIQIVYLPLFERQSPSVVIELQLCDSRRPPISDPTDDLLAVSVSGSAQTFPPHTPPAKKKDEISEKTQEISHLGPDDEVIPSLFFSFLKNTFHHMYSQTFSKEMAKKCPLFPKSRGSFAISSHSWLRKKKKEKKKRIPNLRLRLCQGFVHPSPCGRGSLQISVIELFQNVHFVSACLRS